MTKCILLFFVVVASISECNQQSAKGENESPPTAVAQPGKSTQPDEANTPDKAKDPQLKNPQADFVVAAADLLDEVKKDSKKAEAKYKDKLVQVTGSVYEVEAGRRQVVVKLLGKNSDPDDTQIYAVLAEKDVALGQQLSRKQKVKLTGVFKEAKSLGFFTVLQECRVEELSKSETIHVAASDLAREFTENAAAAGKKYDTKDVIISGEVAALTKGEFNTTHVKLKGNDKLQVSVFVGPNNVSFLKPGQAVKMRSNAPYAPSVEKTEVRFDVGSVLEVK